jgi:hypothetical protein
MRLARIAFSAVVKVVTPKFQFTTSSDSKVIAGTAVWQDWDLGTQTGTVTDYIGCAVTGVRGVSAAGEVSIEIAY